MKHSVCSEVLITSYFVIVYFHELVLEHCGGKPEQADIYRNFVTDE